MQIARALPGEALDGRGAVVVIDVLRTCTTAAFAVLAGAERVIAVSEPQRALRLRSRLHGALVAGDGPFDGFDLPNSPSAVAAARLRGRSLILCSRRGTPALV